MNRIFEVLGKNKIYFKRGSAPAGGIFGGSGSGVPPYDFLKLYGVFGCRFSTSFS
jgi:hypothetical protein